MCHASYRDNWSCLVHQNKLSPSATYSKCDTAEHIVSCSDLRYLWTSAVPYDGVMSRNSRVMSRNSRVMSRNSRVMSRNSRVMSRRISDESCYRWIRHARHFTYEWNMSHILIENVDLDGPPTVWCALCLCLKQCINWSMRDMTCS